MLFSTIEAGTEIQTQPTNQGRVVTILLEKRGIKKKKKKDNTHQMKSRKGAEIWDCRTPGVREVCIKKSPGSCPLGSGPVLSFQNKDTSGGQKYLRKTLKKEAWEV